jgi:hypothetical protein
MEVAYHVYTRRVYHKCRVHHTSSRWWNKVVVCPLEAHYWIKFLERVLAEKNPFGMFAIHPLAEKLM